MTKAIMADNKPVAVELQEGQQYYFCSCGASANQPYCDGSHQGTAFQPLVFIAEKTGTSYLCACKTSANAPFCDGSHSKN